MAARRAHGHAFAGEVQGMDICTGEFTIRLLGS